MAVPAATIDHYKSMQTLQAQAVAVSVRQWSEIKQARIVDSWVNQTATLTPIIADLQYRAALDGATYAAMTLAEQGVYVPPTDYVDPAAIAGFASDGRALGTLLQTPAYGALAYIGEGMATRTALDKGAESIAQIVQTIVADAGRQAAGIDIVARPTTGYVRMLNPPSCARCVVLAGKWFAWNAGFLRHPKCDCVHVASTLKSRAAALREGLIEDQFEYFNSLSKDDQDQTFTHGGAQAIRDGADINQVVNAGRGMTPNGNFTLEGTTRYGNASAGLKRGQRRLTPEGIYDQAARFGKDRDWTLDRLREHGYLLPKGQVPTGALRGQTSGFGQLGGGGNRKAASRAVLDARATGVRDPRSRYTMTAAERRLDVAKMRYEIALGGRSPYRSNPAFTNKPDPSGRLLYVGSGRGSNSHFVPVTPDELATAEREYRIWLASGGQMFTAFDR